MTSVFFYLISVLENQNDNVVTFVFPDGVIKSNLILIKLNAIIVYDKVGNNFFRWKKKFQSKKSLVINFV